MTVQDSISEQAHALRRPSAADGPVALIQGMRPKQWTKNLFVYIALVFTNHLPTSLRDSENLRLFGITTAAFALFCLISGSIYLMNDVADREQDRLHPVKRKRPVASG